MKIWVQCTYSRTSIIRHHWETEIMSDYRDPTDIAMLYLTRKIAWTPPLSPGMTLAPSNHNLTHFSGGNCSLFTRLTIEFEILVASKPSGLTDPIIISLIIPLFSYLKGTATISFLFKPLPRLRKLHILLHLFLPFISLVSLRLLIQGNYYGIRRKSIKPLLHFWWLFLEQLNQFKNV